MRHYEELQTVPEDVPKLDLEAGTRGTIGTVYDGGRMLDVEVGREDGATVGFVDFGVGGDGSLTLVAHTALGNR